MSGKMLYEKYIEEKIIGRKNKDFEKSEKLYQERKKSNLMIIFFITELIIILYLLFT